LRHWPGDNSPDQWSEPVAEPRRAIETAPGGVDFASDVVRCIVSLSDEGPAAGPLSLPFGLTAWMKRHGADLSDTIDTVLRLRGALLAAAGLDAGSEPVPLRVADPVLFVLNLAVYLDGLVGRAARALGVARGDAADAAVELLRSS
jgi:hypothetical protein